MLALLAAYSESCALRALAAAAVPAKECVCDGTCDEVSATDSIPLATPTGSDWLKPRGVRPRRSGRPNVTVPLPPYCVPRSEKRDWFWEIGRRWQSLEAQPRGGKL